MLIPNPDPWLLADALGLIAGLALIRVVVNLVGLVRARAHTLDRFATVRRIGWTAIANLVLAFSAWRIWDSAGAADVIVNLVIVVVVLLIGAADIAWEMLTEVSGEPPR
jgi:RsiW-degrading membrane proteinase PrsW (M82 family)